MSAGFVLREAATGLRRNASMVISVILVTFVSFTFVGAAGLLQLQVAKMKSFWYERAQVAVYLCTKMSSGPTCTTGEASANQKSKIVAALTSGTLQPFIAKYTFQNHQQAYDEVQRIFAGTDVAQYSTPDTLNEAYWIALHDKNAADVIVQTFKGMPGVEQVTDFRKTLDPIFNVLNVSSVTAISIAVIMLVAAALLIATTIRLSAIARRRELGIMRLVGASNRFIQAPFVLEGILAGFIGALLSSATLLVIVKFFIGGYLSQSTSLLSYSYVGLDDVLVIGPMIIAVSVVVAAVSAAIAISRYLRV